MKGFGAASGFLQYNALPLYFQLLSFAVQNPEKIRLTLGRQYLSLPRRL